VGRSVDRFWPSKSPENTRKPVGPEWNRDAPPPSRFPRVFVAATKGERLLFATAANARIRRRDSRSPPLPTPESAAATPVRRRYRRLNPPPLLPTPSCGKPATVFSGPASDPHGARSAADPEILRPQELLPPPTRSSSLRPSSPAKLNSFVSMHYPPHRPLSPCIARCA
jgi:hypothetical protein